MPIQSHNVLRGSFRNVLAVWNATSDDDKSAGAQWYQTARKLGKSLDHEFKLRPNSGAGIIAALSPSMSWENNQIEARSLIVAGWSRLQSAANNHKALRIKAGANPLDVLGGNKVRAFYACIVDADDKRACIDRHAVAVYMGRHISDREQKGLERVGIYDRIANAYQRVADMFGVAVEVVQATVWTAWRSENQWAWRDGVRLGAN